MNRTLYPIITAICLCWSSFVLAQKDWTVSTIQPLIIKSLGEYDSLDYDYQIIQFKEIPTLEDQDKLKILDIQLLEYIGDKKYVSFFPKSLVHIELGDNQVLRIEPIPLQVKLSSDLNSGYIPSWAISKNRLNLILKFYKNIDHDVALSLCKRDNIHLNESNKYNNFLNISIEKHRLLEIAALPYVSYIEAIPEPGRTEDLEGASIHRSNAIDVQYASGRKYDGNGVGLLCRDDGSVGPHIDFQNRLNNSFVENPNTGGGLHGDGVSGVLAGAGNLDPRKKGMAKGADLYVTNYQADFLDETLDLHINNNVLVTNSSYSNGCNGGYTNISATVDQQLFDFPNLMHVFSAGNSNGQNCGFGAGNQWGNITGGHKQAKNCITTANIYPDGTLHETSSRGPAYDGRIKPDISANGAGNISTSPSNEYQEFGGTSAASPGIAGILAQLHQAYRLLNNEQTAPAALLKACLLNSANDLGNPGPDYKFGWGHVNALKALKILENNNYLSGSISHQQTNSHSLPIPPNVKKVNIMLYWQDQEASPFSSIALVNDLDLSVKNSNGIQHLPWVLNTQADSASLDAPATKGVDHLNNMEQVTLINPIAGNYSIDVNGFEVPFGIHDYVIVWEMLTDDIELTYPIGGESFEPGETVRLHWDTAVDPAAFFLSYSMDGGQFFHEIEAVDGSKRMYDWQLPNESTGSLHLKIENSDHTISDQNVTSISIAPTPKNIEVIQACHNYIKVRWSPVEVDSSIDSLQYQVFFLGEKYMESIGFTSTNSFDVPTLFNDPTKDHWIALRTVASNGVRSERSVAIHYNNGLLNCQSGDDIELLSIDSPNEGFLFGCGTYDIPVAVTIRNNGLFPQNEFSLAYSINDGQSIVEDFTQMLLPGQIASYQFEQPIDLLGASDISLKAFSQLGVMIFILMILWRSFFLQPCTRDMERSYHLLKILKLEFSLLNILPL